VKKFYRHTKIKNDSQIIVSQIWDGRDRRRRIVANGNYTYKIDAKIHRVKAEPKFGDVTVTGVLEPPTPSLIIKDVMDSPDPFSPNSDGIDDTTEISAKISISGFDKYLKKHRRLLLIWKLIIEDSQGKRMRRFFHIQKVNNNTEIEISQIWDGKDFRRRVVPDGKYTYRIDARIRRVRAEPGFGDVTVKTVSGLSVSVSPEFWVIGEVEVNSVITMSEVDKITVINDGEVNTTYSLCLINPQGWKASQTETGRETYILNAAFDSDGLLTWDETNHALSTEPVRASLSKFASDQTGIDVEPGQQRTLWLQFKAPTATSIDTEQNIEVIITAELP
jgi:flagellar hook assembly protein FlgD